MIYNEEKVNKFINDILAFKMLPEKYLNFTINKLVNGEWKVYKFNARVKDDRGWEADQTITGEIYATYCWTGNDEYCITSPEYYSKQVIHTYDCKSNCVFSI
jgi:hypothetical protein